MTETTPNFKRLREAYAILAGIPSEQFNLQDIISERGPTLQCGTCACAAGWLALHPQMSKKAGVYIDRTTLKDRRDHDYVSYVGAMSNLFNIDADTAEQLFAPRACYGYLGDDVESDFNGSDKQLWMKRVRTFLKRHKQLSKDCIARGEQP